MSYGIGLDIGITSVGYAVMKLDEADMPCGLEKIGVRMFDAPENPKDGSSLAQPRREARSSRRTIRRRSHRKARIKKLIVSKNLLTKEELETLYDGKNLVDVYKLRVDALDRKLEKQELARVLIHLSQRRGFKSNRKNEAEPKDSKGLLEAIEKNKVSASKYRTVGEILYHRQRRRNAPDDYSNTVLRSDVLDEAHLIFESQRRYGNTICNEQFESIYCDILASQRNFDEGPGGNSPYGGDQIEKMVGQCTFEEGEKRAAKATYSFELFELLQKTNNIRIEVNGYQKTLNNEQRRLLIDKAHTSAGLTYATIRKTLNLPEEALFNSVRYKYNEDKNTSETKTKFTVMKAYHEIRKALDKVSKGRIVEISNDTRNKIGTIFTLYKNDEKIQTALNELLQTSELTKYDIDALIDNVSSFNKFGHLSVIAIDKIIPHLKEGLTYDKACTEAGYDFKGKGGQADKLISLQHLADETENTITSPVARRALSQCAKVINAIIREMDKSPTYINIELAREMSNSFDERKKIEKQMKENSDTNERLKDRIHNEFGRANPTGLDIVKLKLYEEQGGVCIYSLKQMDIEQLFTPGYVDIDHIMPYSQSYDDSYSNKVLCFTNENRQKGNRLPLHYLSGDRKDRFIVWVNNSHLRPAKKRNLLKEAIPEDFKERNLQDTKAISSFMHNYLRNNLKFEQFNTKRKRHVLPVNGMVTSMLRKRWGLSKVREEGDTHHAVDAAVVACTTQGDISFLSRLDDYYEKIETQYIDKKNVGKLEFPQPYKGFSDELYRKQKEIFVSRMPSRKVSGAAHKDTVKGIGGKDETGKDILLKKIPLTELKLKDGEIADWYHGNDPKLYIALKERLTEFNGDANKAFENGFSKVSDDGKVVTTVKKVKIIEKSTLNVLVHNKTGSADNGSMVRVDVFYIDREGYYLIPIYVSDTIKDNLPNKAIVANKPYAKWKEMDDENFLFSLYPNDLIYISTKKPMKLKKVNLKSTIENNIEITDGLFYYKGVDIAVGSIGIITHDNSYENRIGVKTLPLIEKWQVDILGNTTKVKSEARMGFKG